MRYLHTLLAATVLSLGLCVSAAQAQSATNILVIDEGRVFSSADAGRSALAQLKVYGEQISAELDAERKALSTERDRIGQQRATLTPEQLKARITALEKRAGNFEKMADGKARDLDATRTATLKTLNASLQPVLEEIVKARNASILLDKGNLIYAAAALDVTDEVIVKINARLRPFTVTRVKAAVAPAPALAPRPVPAAAR